MPALLSEAEIRRRIRSVDGWRLKGRFITKTYEFESFMEGMAFIGKVARVAQEQDHHPDMAVRYTTVTLSIQTHSEGGITARDFRLARAIDLI